MSAWHRLCAGEYERDGWAISRVEQHAHYGGGYAWVVVEPDGTAWDPFDTLSEAKQACARIDGAVEGISAGR